MTIEGTLSNLKSTRLQYKSGVQGLSHPLVRIRFTQISLMLTTKRRIMLLSTPMLTKNWSLSLKVLITLTVTTWCLEISTRDSSHHRQPTERLSQRPCISNMPTKHCKFQEMVLSTVATTHSR